MHFRSRRHREEGLIRMDPRAGFGVAVLCLLLLLAYQVFSLSRPNRSGAGIIAWPQITAR
jgi:hypothetical protein